MIGATAPRWRAKTCVERPTARRLLAAGNPSRKAASALGENALRGCTRVRHARRSASWRPRRTLEARRSSIHGGLCRLLAPELVEPPVAPAEQPVLVVALRILLVELLVVVLGRPERR